MTYGQPLVGIDKGPDTMRDLGTFPWFLRKIINGFGRSASSLNQIRLEGSGMWESVISSSSIPARE